MKLLIIKSGEDYIRVKDGAFIRCGIDKASVFPLEKLDVVKGHVRSLKARKIGAPAIYQLVLREEPFCGS